MLNFCNKNDTIHTVLSRSYSVYLFSIIVGVIMDTIIVFHFSFNYHAEAGFFVIVLGTLLVYWAQHTSSSSKKESLKKNSPRNFAKGPYKYTRNPTHVGLMLMTLGFGIMIGSYFIVLLTLFSFLTSKLVFLPREEDLLVKKYGEDYVNYQKKVHPWI